MMTEAQQVVTPERQALMSRSFAWPSMTEAQQIASQELQALIAEAKLVFARPLLGMTVEEQWDRARRSGEISTEFIRLSRALYGADLDKLYEETYGERLA